MRFIPSPAAFLACLLLVLNLPAWAAPLFPDTAGEHQARDAVAALAARGLVEGYPDGTFKGDRATSRWEVAMVVARLLEKMESEHASRASEADMQEVRRLALALREELDALGVRVTGMEAGTSRLDRRVGELERISFYGSLDARMVAQSFRNTGAPDNDDGRGGGGLAGGVRYLDYNSAVGSGPAAMWRPQVQGVFPVVDFKNGRALTNGTGFSSTLILGLRVKVSPALDAGAEFAAYTSQGDRNIDAYWGSPAPYLGNPFAANLNGSGAAGAAQGLDHQPYSRMVLDNFWMTHGPSKTKLRLGAIERIQFDPLVYVGSSNCQRYGQGRLPGFGADLSGETSLGDAGKLRWEALAVRTSSANSYEHTDYLPRTLGATAAFESKGGASLVRANVVRNCDEAPAGGPLVVGLISGTNVPYGASKGWNVLQWVNPAGHFAQQRSPYEQAHTGAVDGVFVSNTVDTRPIPGWNATVDNAVGITSGGGNYGPQDQTILGLSARHQWNLDDDTSLRVKAEWARSDYRPSRNSSYSAEGQAFRAEVGAALLAGNLDLSASWLRVAPDYAPMLFSGSLLGLRTVRTWGFVGRFHLHDSNRYPHNRQGLGFNGKWTFDDKHSSLAVTGSWLAQTRTSLYDVRFLPDSLAPAVPNYPVLGFSPGFIDPVFCGYASKLQYGSGSRDAFYGDLGPREDPRGRVRDYQVAFSHSWDDPKVKVELGYNNINWYRPSGLPASLGGSQNRVDLDSDTWSLGGTWEASKAWTLLGGLSLVQVQGHYDPAGLYNGYAERTGSTGFTNLDATQTVPYLGAQWNLGKDTLWECTVSHYGTVDHVPAGVTAGSAPDTIGSTPHPFSFEGWQIQTHFNVKF